MPWYGLEIAAILFLVAGIRYIEALLHLTLPVTMEELIQWLCAIYPLSPECVSYLRSIIKKTELKRHDVLLEEGEICENLYFIEKGLLVCYYMMGRLQVTDWFFWEGETVVSVDSMMLPIIRTDKVVC